MVIRLISRRLARVASFAVAGLVATTTIPAAVAPATAAAPPRATVSVTTTRSTVLNGQPGEITARVRTSTSTAPVATGSVDFIVDGTVYWTDALDSAGRAHLPFGSLTPGTYTFSASYSGDGTYPATVAATPVTVTVLPNAPTAHVTFTPATVTPGAHSQLVVSATNTTSAAMNGVALGIRTTVAGAVVRFPAGASCRRSAGTLYCLFSLRAGATKSLVLDTTAPATPGSYPAYGYARNIDTMDETSASATLTVSG